MERGRPRGPIRGSFGRRDERPRGRPIRRPERPTGARKTLTLQSKGEAIGGGRRLKVRNIDEKQVSNEDLRVIKIPYLTYSFRNSLRRLAS